MSKYYLCSVHLVIELIIKEIKTDWRNKYPVLGILLYLTSIIVISYMSFISFISSEVWNAIFWLIMLFTSVNAIAKSFVQEENRSLYYYFLVSPNKIIASKLIYSNFYQLILVILTFLIFGIFLGSAPEFQNWDLRTRP